MSFYRTQNDGLILKIRVTPNAAQDRIEGPQRRDDGQAMLRIRVQAVPDKSKANKAVIALLAKYFTIPKSAISLVSGQKSRQKTIQLTGDPDALAKICQKLLADQ